MTRSCVTKYHYHMYMWTNYSYLVWYDKWNSWVLWNETTMFANLVTTNFQYESEPTNFLQLEMFESFVTIASKRKARKYVVRKHFLYQDGLLLGDDIHSGLSCMSVCFNFCSTIVGSSVICRFRCHHPLITQLILYHTVYQSLWGIC